jgi:hypothetical protein
MGIVRLLKQKWHNTNSVEITSTPKSTSERKSSSPWSYSRCFRRGIRKSSQKQSSSSRQQQQQRGSRFASNFYVKGCLTLLGAENAVTATVPPISIADNAQNAAPSTSNDSSSRTSSSPLVLFASGALRSFKSSCTAGAADTESLEHNNSFVYETECGPISPQQPPPPPPPQQQQQQQLIPQEQSKKSSNEQHHTSLQAANNDAKPSFSFYSSHLTNSIKSKFNSFKLSHLTYKGLKLE